MAYDPPIAVVGMGCIFPGARDLHTFWKNILAKVDTTREVPAGRWILDPDEAEAAEPLPDKVYSRRGCFVDDFTLDPAGLDVDAALLHDLDPLYHMVLRAGRDAFHDGQTAGLDRDRAGVVLAAIALPTDGASAITRDILGRALEDALLGRNGNGAMTQAAPGRATDASHPLNSRVVSLPAALLATGLGLGGGSYTLDAACASSLYALKLACDELQAGRADAMLAGGVSRPDCLYTQMGFSQLRALSARGRCAPFDASSDGLIVGEGAGIVLLKRLEDAVRDGDRIYGTLRGIGLSNDIGGSLLAPDPEGQLRAMRQAYRESGWSPAEVDLIECHGTGTPLGDAAEVRSLRALWGEQGWHAGQCRIGSIKSMVGHLLTAAGSAGLIKTMLALHNRMLPPSANFDRAAPSMQLDGSPFRVQTASAPWLSREGATARKAAVNAFGFGGINAHVLLEEWGGDDVGTSGVCTHGAEASGNPASPRAETARERTPVAIVGMAAHFGAAASLEAFRQVIFDGETLIRDRPADRWFGLDEQAQRALEGRAMPGAYLEHLLIPAGKYRLPPNEIPEVLPQQLLMLEVVERAMRDAGLATRGRRPRVGALIGMALDLGTTDFHLRWWLTGRTRSWARQLGIELTADEEQRWVAALRDAAAPALNAPRTVGALGNIIASRIAREFDLGGPSYAVSCDEASGLRALELAFRALQRNELDAAVVGAVDLAGDLRAALTAHALRPFSISGQPRPFDASADGTAVGEGAGTVILKRMDDAVRDGDRIYAVLHGIGSAAGGGVGRGGPDERACRMAMERAYTDADVPAGRVGYIEAHGSGDPHEDRIEAAALGTFFAGHPEAPAVGSVKPNVGNTGAAAGMASLIKASLCLFHGVIPPLCGAGRPRNRRSWRRMADGSERVAGVEAITADGNCMHVVLAEAEHTANTSLESREDTATSRPLQSAETRPDRSGHHIAVRIGRKLARPPLPEQLERRAVHVQDPAVCDASRTMPTALACHAQGHSVLDDTSEAGMAQATAATADAHNAYLDFSQTATQAMGAAMAFHSRLIKAMTESEQCLQSWMKPSDPITTLDHETADNVAIAGTSSQPAYSREACLEFARGSAAKVLGAEYAELDTYPIRVRLPDEPLMLVDRILSVEAVRQSLTSGKIVTEHDVRTGAWYLDNDRFPTCMTVEAGQADLFLCSYLGIDLAARGDRTYRLLDATVAFHAGLPRAGDVIRYEISIDQFVRQGDTYLFFFQFDGRVDGRLVLTMRQGCAGFFTAEEIEKSGGIILKKEETEPVPGKRPADEYRFVPMSVESYDEAKIRALRAGDLPGCFGPLFQGLDLRNPARLPDGRMKLFDRVLELDPTGGRYGMGRIRSEADIHPDDWFLTCHFVDDMTMPGTLMYECCLHTLRFFLLRMGWVGEHERVCYEPVAGISSALRCRGPVTPDTKRVIYDVELKEIGFRPEPHVIADALMYADGRRIVQMKDMALQLTGLSRDQIEAIWATRCADETSDADEAAACKPALFDRRRLLAFAVGNPSEAFGEPYRPFDQERRIARLPGPPYQFMDRIVEIEPPPWRLEPGGWIEAEYDVPPDAWYFRANRQSSMPFCVLLEIALQPCGWLAAYMGSALRSKEDLSFRNLNGTATLHEEVFPEAGRLSVRVRLTGVSEAGGMIIEHFDMRVFRCDRLVYEGVTSFGFFSKEALSQQVGIRDAQQRAYKPTDDELARAGKIALKDVPPLTPDDANGTVELHAALPARALRMIDEVAVLVPDGGPHGLGYARAVAAVDPEAWFFKAHFFQDPVWPGSLGLESFLQLLKVIALEVWGPEIATTHRFEPIALGIEHRWAYRGQIIPGHRNVEVEAVVTSRATDSVPTLMASGFLKVDGVCIYEMNDFGLRMVRA